MDKPPTAEEAVMKREEAADMFQQIQQFVFAQDVRAAITLIERQAEALRAYDKLSIRAIPAHKIALIEELHRIQAAQNGEDNDI